MNASVRQPDITISIADYDRLFGLAEFAIKDTPDVGAFLMEELERATIAHQPPAEPTVRMGSYIYYRDASSEDVRRVRLVYPEDSDARRGHISILTPVGAALIGLSAGQTIEWRDRYGHQKTLTVLAVQDESDNLTAPLAG